MERDQARVDFKQRCLAMHSTREARASSVNCGSGFAKQLAQLTAVVCFGTTT